MNCFYIPCPDLQVAKNIASTLLTEKLIACANILSSGESLYWWQGKIETSKEVFLILKTDLSLVDRSRLKQRLQELHPYETACLLELSISSVNSEYEKWIQSSLKES